MKLVSFFTSDDVTVVCYGNKCYLLGFDPYQSGSKASGYTVLAATLFWIGTKVKYLRYIVHLS